MDKLKYNIAKQLLVKSFKYQETSVDEEKEGRENLGGRDRNKIIYDSPNGSNWGADKDDNN